MRDAALVRKAKVRWSLVRARVTLIFVLGWCLCVGSARADPVRDVGLAGGSISGFPVGSLGELDLSTGDKLIFRTQTGRELAMPYDQIRSFAYRKEVTHHLGVLPAIAVGLFAARMHRRLLTVSYMDAEKAMQTILFELPKDGAMVLLPVLRDRTSVCPAKTKVSCGGFLE